MALFTRVKTWVSNEVLTASDLNGEFNNLLNNTKPESIEDYSPDVSTMRTISDPGAVGTESLATSLAGEIERIRYAIKRIVGGAQWYSSPVYNLANTIITDQITDSAVTTPKIADGAITQAKRAALGQQISSASGSFSTTSWTPVDVTNLTVTITTTGRPVVIALIADGSTSTSYLASSGGSLNKAALGYLRLVKDSTTLVNNRLWVQSNATAGGSFPMEVWLPPSVFSYVDVPAAGTYTYKMQTYVETGETGSSTSVVNVKLVAYEL